MNNDHEFVSHVTTDTAPVEETPDTVSSSEVSIIEKSDEELIENGQARHMTADEITPEMREQGLNEENTLIITDPEVIAQMEAHRLAETTE